MMPSRLRQLARERAQNTEGQIGFVLAKLASMEAKPIDLLLTELGLREDPTRLFLCRTPREDQFWEDVQQIASYCQIEANPLMQMLRRYEVLASFATIPAWQTEEGLLMAARDYEEETRDQGDEGH